MEKFSVKTVVEGFVTKSEKIRRSISMPVTHMHYDGWDDKDVKESIKRRISEVMSDCLRQNSIRNYPLRRQGKKIRITVILKAEEIK